MLIIHLGVTNRITMNGVSGVEQAQILKDYREEVLRILRHRQGIYEYKSFDTPSYAFVLGNKVVQIRRDNFEFLTAFTANSSIQLNKILDSTPVTPTSWFNIVAK